MGAAIARAALARLMARHRHVIVFSDEDRAFLLWLAGIEEAVQ